MYARAGTLIVADLEVVKIYIRMQRCVVREVKPFSVMVYECTSKVKILAPGR